MISPSIAFQQCRVRAPFDKLKKSGQKADPCFTGVQDQLRSRAFSGRGDEVKV
jgi:hypothetical protein